VSGSHPGLLPTGGHPPGMDARGEIWSIYRESMPILLVSLAGGVFAGTVLGTEGMREGFRAFPGLLLALPAFLATRGNVYGALGAKIASGLHQGLLDPAPSWDPRLVHAVAAALTNGIGVSAFVAVASWGVLRVSPAADPAPLLHLLGILLLAGLLTASVMIAGLLGLLFAGFDRGVDPDNLVGPLVTTLGDVFGVCFLYAAIVLVGVVT